jgi:hypothetical protein
VSDQGEYVELDLIADPDAYEQMAREWLESQIPGYTWRPGAPEVVMLQANSQILSEVVEQASQFAPVIFSYYGQSLLNIPIGEAASATGTAQFTFSVDVQSLTVEAGTQLAVPNPEGDSFIFTTEDNLIAPEGGGQGTVDITAVDPGAQSNGCFGEADLIDVLDGIDSVYVTTTTGGSDEESQDDYLNRLAAALTILAPRPILPNDFVVMALQVPGVGRAMALDLLQPATTDGGVGLPRDASRHQPTERCITVAVMGEDGGMPSAGLMQTVYDLLNANREVNFLVYVVPPGDNGVATSIDVQASVVAYKGNVTTDVQAAVEDSLNTWLSPETWGGAEQASGQAFAWSYDTKVRVFEAVDWINRAQGVFYVNTVQLKKSTDSTWATGDIDLAGLVPLPAPGNITVTVTIAP